MQSDICRDCGKWFDSQVAAQNPSSFPHENEAEVKSMGYMLPLLIGQMLAIQGSNDVKYGDYERRFFTQVQLHLGIHAMLVGVP